MGECIAEAEVLYASPAGGDAASCSQTEPCSITRAFALVTTTRQTVKLSAGTYVANVIISGKNAVIDGYGATLMNVAGKRTIQIAESARVDIRGLTIRNTETSGTNGMAIACDMGATGTSRTLSVVDAVIESGNTGVFANQCALSMSRSRVDASQVGLGAIYVVASTAMIDRTLIDSGNGVIGDTASVVHVTNSVIAHQGAQGAVLGGFNFGTTPGAVTVSFSTIVDSLVKCADGVPSCQPGGTAAGACVDNSIIVNTLGGAPANTVSGTACVVNYALVFPQSAALNGTNNKPGIDPRLAGPATGDYHLQAASPAIDAADPAVTASPDFDGTSRPQGARSDLGAFEFKP